MATSDSRLVLDWLRTWSVGKLDAIGRSDITSSMNVPLTSDVRVNAALNYIAGVRADALAAALAFPGDLWASEQGKSWYEIKRSMPADVRAAWDQLWTDPDQNVRTLVKSLMVTVSLLYFVNVNGG